MKLRCGIFIYSFIVFYLQRPVDSDSHCCDSKSFYSLYSSSTDSKCYVKPPKERPTSTERRLHAPIPPWKQQQQETKEEEGNKRTYVRLPELRTTHVNEEQLVELAEGYYTKVRTLSVVPPIFEINSFLDEEECDLLIAYAKYKGQKKSEEKEWAPFIQGSPEAMFQEWDYNEDGFVDVSEIALAPGKSDIIFTKEDADDMLFILKMDKDRDGKLSLEELQNTDFAAIKNWITNLKKKEEIQRNLTTGTTWVWHDKDELLRFGDDYFYEYHNRISKVTGLPKEIIEESEAIQVQQFNEGNFQLCRHDSEYVVEEIPCCLYGDRSSCRLCRYISMVVFLNDVEEGGELVFPLANTTYQDIKDNVGEWRGYFTYSKTTGSKSHFTVNMTMTLSGVNRIVSGQGQDDVGVFELVNGVMIGDTVRFEKKYVDLGEQGEMIKYSGKVVSGTQIYGKWWVPGQTRVKGEFHMWSKSYQTFSKNATDSCNVKSECKKANVVIKPSQGKAIFWYNHHRDDRTGMVGQLNKETMVGHCDVIKGQKWTANIWLNVVGDGIKELRAWRKGLNWMKDINKYPNIIKTMGSNEPPLPIYVFEEEYERDMMKGDQTLNRTVQDVESYRSAKTEIKNSHILNAVTSLLNVIDEAGLKTVSSVVHSKLSLTCIPLVVEENGRVSLGEGRH